MDSIRRLRLLLVFMLFLSVAYVGSFFVSYVMKVMRDREIADRDRRIIETQIEEERLALEKKKRAEEQRRRSDALQAILQEKLVTNPSLDIPGSKYSINRNAEIWEVAFDNFPSNSSLDQLAEIKSELLQVSFKSSKIDLGSALAKVNFNAVRTLEFEKCEIVGELRAEIFPSLERLQFVECSFGGVIFNGEYSIENFWATNCTFTGPLFSSTAEFPKCDSFNLGLKMRAKLERDDLQAICRIPKLKIAMLNNLNGVDEFIKGSRSRGTLWMVSLSHTDVSDTECAELASLPGIRAVHIVDAEVTDKGVEELCRVNNLESIVLVEVDITEKSISRLSSLPKLMVVQVDDKFKGMVREILPTEIVH